jgi:hypothetical protein
VLPQAHCAQRHADGRIEASPLRHPVEDLAKPLAEGIVTGHPTMPEFRFDPAQIGDVIAYEDSATTTAATVSNARRRRLPG